MAKQYTVIIEKAGENWSAYVPDLPGCVSTGMSREETAENIREAIRGHLAVMRDFGDPIPEPSTTTILVDAA